MGSDRAVVQLCRVEFGPAHVTLYGPDTPPRIPSEAVLEYQHGEVPLLFLCHIRPLHKMLAADQSEARKMEGIAARVLANLYKASVEPVGFLERTALEDMTRPSTVRSIAEILRSAEDWARLLDEVADHIPGSVREELEERSLPLIIHCDDSKGDA